MQPEKMEVICFEACGPHCVNIHVKLFLSEGFPHCNMRTQFENLHQVNVVNKRIQLEASVDIIIKIKWNEQSKGIT